MHFTVHHNIIYHSFESTVVANKLSIKDLSIVQNLIWEARTKWMNIGLHLGIIEPELKAIEKKYDKDPDECFREMLSICLKQERRCTWNDITNALKDKTVGFGHLATEVELRAKTSTTDSVSLDYDSEDIRLKSCPCGECTLDSYVSKGCSMSSREFRSYPYLEMEDLDESAKEDLIQVLNNDTAEINKRFARLRVETLKSFKEQNIEVDTLAHAALCVEAQECVDTPKSLLQAEEELLEAKAIDRAFIVLGRHMSFFNYEVLHQIITSLGNDADKERLKAYEESFNHFCERKTFQVSPNVFHNSQPGKRRAFLVMITKKMQSSFKLNDILEQKRKFATILGLKSSMLLIHRIDEGSILILFSIPESVARQIFPLTSLKVSELEAKGFSITNLKPRHTVSQLL